MHCRIILSRLLLPGILNCRYATSFLLTCNILFSRLRTAGSFSILFYCRLRRVPASGRAVAFSIHRLRRAYCFAIAQPAWIFLFSGAAIYRLRRGSTASAGGLADRSCVRYGLLPLFRLDPSFLRISLEIMSSRPYSIRSVVINSVRHVVAPLLHSELELMTTDRMDHLPAPWTLASGQSPGGWQMGCGHSRVKAKPGNSFGGRYAAGMRSSKGKLTAQSQISN